MPPRTRGYVEDGICPKETLTLLKNAVGVRVVRKLPQIDILLQVASGSA